MYPPGTQAGVSVALHNIGKTGFAGTLTLAMWDQAGLPVGTPLVRGLALPAGGRSTSNFTIRVPGIDGRGYLLGVRAIAGGQVRDAASGAIDAGMDWRRFPRYGWVSQFAPGEDAAATVDLLAAYKLNALQFYDVAYKPHVPAPPPGRATWPNLANRPVSRDTVQALLARAHAQGMIGLIFNDWSAAYDDYRTDGSGAKAAWGLYTRQCSTSNPCGPADQASFGGGPGVWRGYGWAAGGLALFDPASAGWQDFLFRGMREAIGTLGFDGWQIDTLGAPNAARFAADGSQRDPGLALVPFANAARAAIGSRTVLNNVSRWQERAVAAGTTTDVLYTEIHPEFGDTPFYPALNGFAAQVRHVTPRSLVIAAYMDQTLARSPLCKSNPEACRFGAPGIRAVDSMMLAAGAWHFELGDRNAGCVPTQAKLASNIYLPGRMLCMDPELAVWMADAANFGVGYENLLRDGVTDAPEDVWLEPRDLGSRVGAAGRIYLLPKRKADFQILHLLNFSAFPTIRLDDPDGSQPAPAVREALRVTMHYAGPPVREEMNTLRWASPDWQHGAPQIIRHYITGQDASGRTISFVLPQLHYWDMVWLRTGAAGRNGQ